MARVKNYVKTENDGGEFLIVPEMRGNMLVWREV